MVLRRWIAVAFAVVLTTSAAWPQQAKTIKDPAEYKTYIAALKLTNPAQKAAAMEAFAARYPKSVVRIDALEQAMAAYQQAGNAPKVESSAEHILHIEPNNVRALAIATFLKRSAATHGNATAAAASAADAERGLKALPHWRKPSGISDAEFKKLRDQMAAIFEGAAGFSALQAKDYASAASLDVAITDDNQKSNTVDMRVMLAKPLAAVPAAGAVLDVTGAITGYTPKPFLFQMVNGRVGGEIPMVSRSCPRFRTR